MIKVSGLTKYYGNKKAIEDISFELEDGKIYGFLGPNGAGKSTTMNIMTGYIGATSGSVEINGYDILEEPEKAKKNIGYLPEIPPLYPDMTVEEYLLFAAELKGVPKKERKDHVREIEDKTGISEVRGRLIKYLSKGYRQRVGFAQALVSYPDVIILDEPTVGLDPIQLNEMRELIKSLREKHTVILSSHIMQEVSAVCDTILIISEGKLVANDNAESLSAKTEASTVLIYRIKSDAGNVRKILEGFDSIKISECRDDNGNTYCELETADDPDRLQNDIFFAFADKKIAILESRIMTKSLEDIFIDYTNS
ncbi:MAG: ATP-binding cassette domain-containing protein [Lachnospiraceae bacterium]|nr:ATP-binding cassette domain-containing protein [Lachnospiraceae bacterium]